MAPLIRALLQPRLAYIEDQLAGQRVLVLGAGHLPALDQVAQVTRELVIVDPSEARLEYARRRVVSASAQLQLAPLHDTGLPDAGFDVILAFHPPFQASIQRTLLAEIRRLLDREGFLYLNLPAPEEGREDDSRPDLPALRSSLRRYFAHVEVLTQHLGIGVIIGKDPQALPTLRLPDDATPLDTEYLVLCSQLLIVPEDRMLALLPLGPHLAALHQRLGRVQAHARRLEARLTKAPVASDDPELPGRSSAAPSGPAPDASAAPALSPQPEEAPVPLTASELEFESDLIGASLLPFEVLAPRSPTGPADAALLEDELTPTSPGFFPPPATLPLALERIRDLESALDEAEAAYEAAERLRVLLSRQLEDAYALIAEQQSTLEALDAQLQALSRTSEAHEARYHDARGEIEILLAEHAQLEAGLELAQAELEALRAVAVEQTERRGGGQTPTLAATGVGTSPLVSGEGSPLGSTAGADPSGPPDFERRLAAEQLKSWKLEDQNTLLLSLLEAHRVPLPPGLELDGLLAGADALPTPVPAAAGSPGAVGATPEGPMAPAPTSKFDDAGGFGLEDPPLSLERPEPEVATLPEPVRRVAPGGLAAPLRSNAEAAGTRHEAPADALASSNELSLWLTSPGLAPSRARPTPLPPPIVEEGVDPDWKLDDLLGEDAESPPSPRKASSAPLPEAPPRRRRIGDAFAAQFETPSDRAPEEETPSGDVPLPWSGTRPRIPLPDDATRRALLEWDTPEAASPPTPKTATPAGDPVPGSNTPPADDPTISQLLEELEGPSPSLRTQPPPASKAVTQEMPRPTRGELALLEALSSPNLGTLPSVASLEEDPLDRAMLDAPLQELTAGLASSARPASPSMPEPRPARQLEPELESIPPAPTTPADAKDPLVKRLFQRWWR